MVPLRVIGAGQAKKNSAAKPVTAASRVRRGPPWTKAKTVAFAGTALERSDLSTGLGAQAGARDRRAGRGAHSSRRTGACPPPPCAAGGTPERRCHRARPGLSPARRAGPRCDWTGSRGRTTARREARPADRHRRQGHRGGTGRQAGHRRDSGRFRTARETSPCCRGGTKQAGDCRSVRRCRIHIWPTFGSAFLKRTVEARACIVGAFRSPDRPVLPDCEAPDPVKNCLHHISPVRRGPEAMTAGYADRLAEVRAATTPTGVPSPDGEVGLPDPLNRLRRRIARSARHPERDREELVLGQVAWSRSSEV